MPLARTALFIFGCLALARAADTEPSRLRFAVPEHWTVAIDSKTGFVTLSAPDGKASLAFLASTPFTGEAADWRERLWSAVTEKARALGTPHSGVQGKFLTRTAVLAQPDGARPHVRLYVLVTHGRGEGVLFVAAHEQEFLAHLPTVNSIVDALAMAAPADLAGSGSGSRVHSATTPSNNPRPPDRSGSFTLADYEFTPPEGWQAQTRADHILLTQSPAGDGCVVQILPPQPSSGDLERDARAVFDLMYPGWQYRRSGPQRYTVAKGILPRGLAYCLYEASMSATAADGRYHVEDGAALVISLGDRIAIVAARHRDLLAHIDCHRRYATWRRFFNSLHVRGALAAPAEMPPPAERIVGRWRMTESAASAEYLFAANGNYAFVGALGSASTTADSRYEYLHIKTYAFPGDGSYAISGRQLTLAKRGAREPERRWLRFETVNHGGTGWRERLWLLGGSGAAENEVCYERALP